ncbi:hypothetical protein [Burkholderia gladioli]|uniref:hypothetical protein n=1 Tax=Burkholderia gladioli TaxID=28095 RepID=UPI00163EDDB4|nr:hypothetical protein [Burkholderia gladioli]MBJ9677924.1 hypothetical protein [Burkholderia gladioli]
MPDVLTVAQAATQPVNWLVVAASSAVISAAINSFSNWRLRISDRKREDAAAALRSAHWQFDLALALEAFAQSASAYMTQIDEALARAADHDPHAFDRVDDVRLTFDAGSDRPWIELPLALAGKVRAIPVEMADTARWISDAWVHWADEQETYEFERQRALHYGWVAVELAGDIRREIKLSRSENAWSYRDRFASEFDMICQNYLRRQAAGLELDVIPEIEGRLLRAGITPAAASTASVPNDSSI